MTFIASILTMALCASMTALGILIGQALWPVAGVFSVDYGVVAACVVVAIASGVSLVNLAASQVEHLS